MYDRAPRWKWAGSDTGALLSPATYAVPRDDFSKGRSYVSSFKACANRDSFLTKTAYPPVGHYDVQYPEVHIHGGSTLSNRTARFPWGKGGGPSPCQYRREEVQTLYGRVRQTDRIMKRVPVIPVKLKSSLPFGGVTCIPANERQFYTEDPVIGCLVREPPIAEILPSDYYAINEERAADRAKDCHFGNRTAFRKQILHMSEATRFLYDVRPRPFPKRKSPRFLTLKRFMTALIDECQKENFPGVGTYDVTNGSNFLPLETVYGIDGEPVRRAPFLQSARVRDVKPTTCIKPEPGSYEPEFPPLSVSFNVKRNVSFGGGLSKRFKVIKPQSADTMYNIPGFTDILVQEQQRSSRIRSCFNVRAPRFIYKPKIDCRQIFAGSPSEHKPGGVAAFKSRKRESTNKEKMNTDPTKYNVVESFEASQGKRPPVSGISSETMRQRKIGFWTGGPRFDKRMLVPNPTFPGPGHIDITSDILKTSGRFCFRSERFQEKIERTPGPADYEVGPELAENTVPGTRNITIGNPQLYIRPKYYRMRPENIQTNIHKKLSTARQAAIRDKRNWEQMMERCGVRRPKYAVLPPIHEAQSGDVIHDDNENPLRSYYGNKC